MTSISCPGSDIDLASGLNALSLCPHQKDGEVGGRSTAGALCPPACAVPGGPGLDLHCQSLISEGCLLSRYSSSRGLMGRMLVLRAGVGMEVVKLELDLSCPTRLSGFHRTGFH